MIYPNGTCHKVRCSFCLQDFNYAKAMQLQKNVDLRNREIILRVIMRC